MEKVKQQWVLSIWAYPLPHQKLAIFFKILLFHFDLYKAMNPSFAFVFFFLFFHFRRCGGRGVHRSAQMNTFLWKTWKNFQIILKSYMFYMNIDYISLIIYEYYCLYCFVWLFDWWCLTPFSTIFQLYRDIVAVSFIGGGNQMIPWKPQTCQKSLRNFII